MKKVLFCGGSHLAHAKVVIDKWAVSGEGNIKVEYLVTAGVQVRKWLSSGKQFTYTEEEGVILPSINLNSVKSFFPKEYDYIVIIGNYYLPRRLVDFIKLWNIPMSDIIEKEIIVNSFSDVPLGGEKSFKNNLVDIIAEFKGAQTQLLLVPDPRMINTIEHLPSHFIEKYYRYLCDYLESKKFKYIPHDLSSIDPNTGSSLEFFKREIQDSIHMNDEYWELQMRPVLSLLRQK